MRIGMAGLGRMGAAMALRLKDCGHDITVWNRSADKAKPVVEAGATLAPTPAALAGAVDVVITMLTDAAALAAVYDGPSGILAADLSGKLVIEMSTVRPQTEIALAAKVRAKGAAFVECPVGGTITPARQGQLIGMMGAEAADAARARPILEQLCRRIEPCGPVGSGALMKLTINLPLLIYWQALGEALALSRSLGLDPDRVVDFFSDTAGGSNALKQRGSVIAKALKTGEEGAVTFDVVGAIKDLSTMIAEGKAQGISLPLVERSLACYLQTQAEGRGDLEAALQSVYWAKRGAS